MKLPNENEPLIWYHRTEVEELLRQCVAICERSIQPGCTKDLMVAAQNTTAAGCAGDIKREFEL